MPVRRVRVIDSHTGGEPTRVVISGAPDLGNGSLCSARALQRRARRLSSRGRERATRFGRGRGRVAVSPVDDSCVTGVIFFNSVTYLGMCGHGTIGVVATLAYLNRIGPGQHRIETPVGVVVAHLDDDGDVEVANVPSYRLAAKVTVDVPGMDQ
jgi:4-hydroxyproline epimerase